MFDCILFAICGHLSKVLNLKNCLKNYDRAAIAYSINAKL